MDQFTYYTLIFVLSFLLMLLYLFNWRKQFHVSFTAIFILLPILELTYLLLYCYHDLTTAIALSKINSICAFFLPAMITFCELSLCNIHVKRELRTMIILVPSVVMIPFMLMDVLRPNSITIQEIGSVWVVQRDYGVYQKIYNTLLILFLTLDVLLLFYTYFHKKQVSRLILSLLLLPLALSILTYVAGMVLFNPGYEAMPLAYVISEWLYLWVVDRICYHSVSDIVTESMVEAGDVGFITMDDKGKYLGSNEKARMILPELENLTVDHYIGNNKIMQNTVFNWIEQYKKNPTQDLLFAATASKAESSILDIILEANKEDSEKESKESEREKRKKLKKAPLKRQKKNEQKESSESGSAHGLTQKRMTEPQDSQITQEHIRFVSNILREDENARFYIVNVGPLYYGGQRRGYHIFLADDTQNQKYIIFYANFNRTLQTEVEAKTKRIVEMHDQLIMGMATMVESRDNSTGGHIRRTSEGVRLLIEAIQEDGSLHLSEDFCNRLIKAAPMHDLGKIAVDDAILRKPGRYTPEEFNVMKSHAAEGARIVHEILKDSDDEQFRRIAENVAHYHHERMDGSGYPDGLKGDAIPLEARIMAIADVYDALVSKRVYKDSYSFDTADRIILEGMGTQFDENLKKYYLEAKPKLEAFYSSIDKNEKEAAGMA